MLVTAVSAVGQADRVQVIASGGEALMGTVRGIDPATDVAVVAVEGNWPSAERRLDPAARVGDFVFAVGRDASGMVHASFGHVGAVAGAWRSWRGGQLDRYIRLDGGLYPGLVGAPVCDVQGQVVGIATAVLARHHGMVVPASTIDRIADALLSHGRVRRGHLGIAAQPVPLSPAMRAAAAAPPTPACLYRASARGAPRRAGDCWWAISSWPWAAGPCPVWKRCVTC